MKHAKAAILSIASSLLFLQGCAPLLVGGAAIGSAFVSTDRRTSGSQLEDQGIEIRTSSRLNQQLPERKHINVTSYNRRVLLSGEVPSEAQKQQAGSIAANVENVIQVYNELAVMPNSGLSDRASDSMITARVNSALVDAKDLYANSVTVTTERSIVYLMGRVTQREAGRITDIASTTKGVFKVVSLLEIISPEEMQRTLPQAPAPQQVRYTAPAGTVTQADPPPLPMNATPVRETQAPSPVESRMTNSAR